MEATRKRRGFIKARLPLPFYRGAKASAAMQYSSKVNPSRSSPTPSVLVSEGVAFLPAKQKASLMKADDGHDNGSGGADFVDDNVDKRAASYISYVQEKFKLERMNSDRKRMEEML